MAKTFKTVPTLDAIAAIFAADDHQEMLAKALNSKFDRSTFKPSSAFWVTYPDPDHKNETTSTQIPSVSDFAKVTLGLDNKWIDKKAVAVTVTDDHRQQAKDAMDAISNAVMMQVLQGKTVNGFIGNLAKELENEEVPGRALGLLSFVPKTARQFMENAKVDEKKAEFRDSKALGSNGDKVFATVTIFNTRAMTQYESILYEGHDDKGNLITFFKNEASKAQFEVGQTYDINGKIKNVGETPYSFGAIVNTLNYVRKSK